MESPAHVWFFRTDSEDSELGALTKLLCPEEIARGARLIHLEQRRRWLCTRACVRLILARELGLGPQDLRFTIGPLGKPFLQWEAGSERFAFNVSHSAGGALVCIASAATVGVDLEALKPLADMDALVQRFFQQSERDWLSALPTAVQLRGFFRLWVLKEAVLKARGTGLGELERLTIDYAAATPNPWTVRGSPDWQIQELDVDPEFCAALALPCHMQDVRFTAVTVAELLAQ